MQLINIKWAALQFPCILNKHYRIHALVNCVTSQITVVGKKLRPFK